ncbi:oligopeptide ABC transpoter oligopeptide-binding protein [Bradyrhizobium sp. CCBAU 11434]|uniref:ABC transporter substrate-binding protein n=1 Tax=Bradyrhizobium sp. CCBAU 11434 TaxID=1630885 RepID=UPI0023054830|nr:ABC transporter substrate-binding protein [Bradyrhizobium sp. CCBAU 11434]MDA9523402.1 oligopeptide ABC transpoter oligopeptide-binding protein [Bradyrhizobium sp. CCBAU 11434]
MTRYDLTRRQALTGALSASMLASTGLGAVKNDFRKLPRRRLTVGMSGFPRAFDPVIATDTAIRRIMPQLFDTLITFDHGRDMTLRPCLAEKWERIDARSLRLFLRKDVTFHDGAPLTAEDVAFSLGPDHLLGPGRSGMSEALQSLDRLEKVEIIDPYIVVVHAKGGDALLEQRLAAWGSEIVSKRAFTAAGSWERWMTAPVGSGPYKLVDHKLDIHVTLAAHNGYWGGRPAFEGIEYRILPELSARVNGLLAGELDIVTDIPPDQFEGIQKRADLEVVGGPVQNIRSLVLDQTDPVLKDVRVRRAISLALDRRLIVESLWENRLPIPNGYQLPSYGESYIQDFPALAYDPDKAKELLAAARYNGEQITYRLLNNYYPNQVSTAQIMIEMWRAVGLNVKIQMMENFAQVQGQPVRAIFDTSNTALFLDHLGHPWREYGPSGSLPKSIGVWHNEEYFSLGAKLQDTVQPDQRRPIIRRMLEIINEVDPPCVILHVSGQFYGKRRDVPWLPGLTLDLDFGPRNKALIRT